MSRRLAAEVLKLRTVRTGWWLGLSMAALVVLPLVSVLASESESTLAELGEQRSIVRLAAIGDVFALLLGIVVIGGELSHGTITQTFLVEPVRARVLVAKAALGAVGGCAFAAAALALVIAIETAWLSGSGIDLELGDPELRRVVVGILVAGGLAGALGVGWGALFRGQGSAIAAALVWLLIGENVLGIALGDARKYGPGAAFAATVSGNRSPSDGDVLLGIWPGTLLALAYAAAFVAAGMLVIARRDV
jgi:ABC-2 type transport system permease protein